MSQVGEIDVNDVELLSTSINAIERAYTEKMRFELLKKIVIDSESILQSAFKSLEGELGSLGRKRQGFLWKKNYVFAYNYSTILIAVRPVTINVV